MWCDPWPRHPPAPDVLGAAVHRADTVRHLRRADRTAEPAAAELGIHSCHTVTGVPHIRSSDQGFRGHVPRERPDVSSLLRVVTLLAPGLLPRFIGLVIMSRMIGAVGI